MGGDDEMMRGDLWHLFCEELALHLGRCGCWLAGALVRSTIPRCADREALVTAARWELRQHRDPVIQAVFGPDDFDPWRPSAVVYERARLAGLPIAALEAR